MIDNDALMAQIEAYALRNGIFKTDLSRRVIKHGNAYSSLKRGTLGRVSKQAFMHFMAANPDALGIPKARAKLTEEQKAENRKKSQKVRYRKYIARAPDGSGRCGISQRIDMSKLTFSAGHPCFKCGANPNKVRCNCSGNHVTFITSAADKIVGGEA